MVSRYRLGRGHRAAPRQRNLPLCKVEPLVTGGMVATEQGSADRRVAPLRLFGRARPRAGGCLPQCPSRVEQM